MGKTDVEVVLDVNARRLQKWGRPINAAEACGLGKSNIFGLPPLLDGHREEQFRIASAGLSLLRELAFAVHRSGESGNDLSVTELASLCEIAAIDVPRCAPGADVSVVSRRIGTILGPLFREAEELVVEGFVVRRIQKDVYDEIRKENRPSKFYRFTQVDR
jgi:hypothetical protein